MSEYYNSCPKNKPIRDKKYLAYIRKQPCTTCLCMHSVPHHESISGRGTGIKCSDTETIPLCTVCHNERHTLGKKSFAKKYNIDYVKEIRRLQVLYKKS